MNLELEGRAAVIGGASRGIGRAIAEAFLAEGADVGLIARDGAALEAAAEELRAAHPDRRVATAAANLADAAAAGDAVGALAGELGRVDAVVANAGSGRGDRDWAAGEDEWRRLLDTNLITAVNLCRAGGERLGEGGAIALVGSIAGLVHLPAPLPYNAAKAALTRYGHDLAAALAPRGVRVNVVAPGNVLFPGGRWEELLAADREGVEAMIAAEVPLGRFATPREIADAVVFLCSPRSAFTTGTTLVVDGGQAGA